MTFAPAVLALFPPLTGTYVHAVGQVGSGGFEQRLALKTDGTFDYASQGCFTNEARTGTYRRALDRVVLTERPDAREAWKGKAFRLVRARDGSLTLVDERRQAFDRVEPVPVGTPTRIRRSTHAERGSAVPAPMSPR